MPGPKLTKGKAQKLLRLLHMRYKPAEIARELGVEADTIYRSYLPAGAPFTRDDHGQIWIVGTDFRKWAHDYVTTRENQPKAPMGADQAYCCRCQKVITMVNPRTRPANGHGVINLAAKCPECEGKVNRMIAGKELEEVQETRRRGDAETRG